MRNLSNIILILMFLSPMIMGASSGCPNLFVELSSKTTDDALLYQARLYLDSRDYDLAVTAIESMTTTGKAVRETRTVLASAYAGLCGLELIDLAKSIADGVTAGTKLYPILLTAFATSTRTSVDNCKLAEDQLLAISTTASERTDDENVFLAFVEFAKLGAILGATGVDADDDATIDGAFDPCTNDATNIEDLDVQHIGTALTIALASLGASGSSVASDVTTTFSTVCSSLDTALGTTGFCDQTSPSDFDANEVKGLRALIKSNEIGFNTCGGAVASSVPCLCL